MKHLISGSAIALLLMTATPAAAEVGGTITRQAPAQTTITTLVMAVLDLFTWESSTGSINFDKGSFSANAGCNNIFGSYNVAGTAIDFGEPASTLMYCEDKMENEAALIATLDAATIMTFQDGKLILSYGTTTARFAATFATTSINPSK